MSTPYQQDFWGDGWTPSCTHLWCLLDFSWTCPIKASAVKPCPMPTLSCQSTCKSTNTGCLFLTLVRRCKSKENENKTVSVYANLCQQDFWRDGWTYVWASWSKSESKVHVLFWHWLHVAAHARSLVETHICVSKLCMIVEPTSFHMPSNCPAHPLWSLGRPALQCFGATLQRRCISEQWATEWAWSSSKDKSRFSSQLKLTTKDGREWQSLEFNQYGNLWKHKCNFKKLFFHKFSNWKSVLPQVLKYGC